MHYQYFIHSPYSMKWRNYPEIEKKMEMLVNISNYYYICTRKRLLLSVLSKMEDNLLSALNKFGYGCTI
jgi:hypothetical protein